MPSVMGLIEEREVAARQRVESLRDELDRLGAKLEEAEAARDRLVIAKETVSEVLSEAVEPEGARVSQDARPVEPEPAMARAVPGSVVPVRREGLDVTVLPPDYQRIMRVLADRERSGEGPAICRQLADMLDLELVPAKIEGVRSKAKRLAARGWLAEDTPGSFSLAVSRGGGS
ncbi:hypothetical protein BCL80_1382 [Streptomyces avidinii]|uniref:hypothetical protein n=1 Tax=[Kitasatospora] papulosa TaxID=1464011 RepID=UPI000BCF0B06|nr:hypothetical protein BCL80_1382 [Streptomyces avidinii]SNX81288.1 hypothetical protein SAMN05421860_1361 [Streptomyces microflavus]